MCVDKTTCPGESVGGQERKTAGRRRPHDFQKAPREGLILKAQKVLEDFGGVSTGLTLYVTITC